MKEKNAIEKLLELPEEKLDKIIEKLSSNESDKLMYQLWDLLNVLPENCRVYRLKHLIDTVTLHIQYNNKYSDYNFCYCENKCKDKFLGEIVICEDTEEK